MISYNNIKELTTTSGTQYTILYFIAYHVHVQLHHIYKVKLLHLFPLNKFVVLCIEQVVFLVEKNIDIQ